MILKYWFFILWVGFSAYGSFRTLSNAHLLYNGNHWQYYFYWSAPFILLALSAKGWTTSRMWRRMMAHRQTRPTLSRGDHQVKGIKQRPSILERVCLVLVAFSLLTLWRIFL